MSTYYARTIKDADGYLSVFDHSGIEVRSSTMGGVRLDCERSIQESTGEDEPVLVILHA